MTRQGWIQRASLSIIGAVAYGKLVGDTFSRVARGITYPSSHETRVADTIATTLWTAAAATTSTTTTTTDTSKILRVLEVGLGSECRLLRRGLYNKAFQGLLHDNNCDSIVGTCTTTSTTTTTTINSRRKAPIQRVELIGLDLHPPSDSLIQQVQKDLEQNAPLPVDFMVMTGDIADPPTSLLLSSSSSSSKLFDAIICCFTLCSVDNPELAIQQIKKLLQPDGGCFGYIEHVAALYTDPTATSTNRNQNKLFDDGFLDWQQQTLDPLQQALADNCHLHRRTDEIIDSVFDTTTTKPVRTGTVVAQRLEQERFLVPDMWPVAMQSRGIIQQIIC